MKDSRQTIQDLTLLNFGKERCCSSQQYGPFSRESSSIYIILSGKGLVTLDSHTYTLSAGDSFCIEAGQMALYQADAEDPWTYIWVDFCGFMTSSILLKANYSRFKPIVHLDSTEKFEALVQSLFQIKGHLFVDELERRGLFFHFIAQLIRNNKSRRGEEKDIFDTASYYAHETYEYIQYNFTRPLHIHHIAEELGISRNYLCHCFKKVYAISPKEFLIQTRMEYALGLLSHKNMSIVAICQCVGYSDSITFSKAFKRIYGMSPSLFRQQMKENTT